MRCDLIGHAVEGEVDGGHIAGVHRGAKAFPGCAGGKSSSLQDHTGSRADDHENMLSATCRISSLVIPRCASVSSMYSKLRLSGL